MHVLMHSAAPVDESGEPMCVRRDCNAAHSRMVREPGSTVLRCSMCGELAREPVELTAARLTASFERAPRSRIRRDRRGL